MVALDRRMLPAGAARMSQQSSLTAPLAWQKITPAEAGFASDLGARLDKRLADKRACGLHGVAVARARRSVLERLSTRVLREVMLASIR